MTCAQVVIILFALTRVPVEVRGLMLARLGAMFARYSANVQSLHARCTKNHPLFVTRWRWWWYAFVVVVQAGKSRLLVLLSAVLRYPSRQFENASRCHVIPVAVLLWRRPIFVVAADRSGNWWTSSAADPSTVRVSPPPSWVNSFTSCWQWFLRGRTTRRRGSTRTTSADASRSSSIMYVPTATFALYRYAVFSMSDYARYVRRWESHTRGSRLEVKNVEGSARVHRRLANGLACFRHHRLTPVEERIPKQNNAFHSRIALTFSE